MRRRHSEKASVIAKKAYVAKYKMEKGCSNCGYSESPAALDFDHIDRTKKNFKLSKAYKYTWEKIHEEIENCVILCANCHRVKTAKEKDYMETDWVEEETPQLDLL